jgi:hypothetical protein
MLDCTDCLVAWRKRGVMVTVVLVISILKFYLCLRTVASSFVSGGSFLRSI